MIDINAIETLAVNSWKTASITGQWRAIRWQFIGIHRLALWQEDVSEAAELAGFIADIAMTRAWQNDQCSC